jgi:hypothetical protein
VIVRLQVWTLMAGCVLYGLTQGAVFDRYLLSWGVLLPIAWVATLPRGLLVVQGTVLALMGVRPAWRLLIST